MKKILKNATSLILAISMLAMILNVNVWAAEADKENGDYKIKVTSATPYRCEYKIPDIDGAVYSAMEFYLGTAEYTEVGGIDQYASVRIMTTKDAAYSTGSGVDKTYIFKIGAHQRFIALPVTSTTQGMKMIIQHGYLDESGAFQRFAADDGYGVAQGSFKLGIFGFKLYKNKNAFVSKLALGANNLGTAQTLEKLTNIQDSWGKGTTFYMGDKIQQDVYYSDGQYWSQDITKSRNSETAAGSVKLTFVTEGYIDRFTGTIGVAAGQSVGAREEDYIVIKGYNWKNPQSRDVNVKFDSAEGVVLYSAYGMKDGFTEAFDIEVSGYDYIKIFTNFDATRRASLMDYAFHQYNAKEIKTSFDKETGIITSTSKQGRSAGTMAAVSYIDGAPSKTALNNTAVLGTETVSIQGHKDFAQKAKVLAQDTLDCSSMLNDDYIKYYYLDGVALDTLTVDDLSALSEESLIETYVVPYNISDVKANEIVFVELGTAIENIQLPKTITVVAAENEFDGIGVTWNTSSYNKNIAGEYTLTGTLNADDLKARRLSNTNDLKASITVKVKAPCQRQ